MVFVLGVYASAVHARWVGPDGRTVVRALAVASEPSIFWRGEGADQIISGIRVPAEAGRLVPADPQMNGPSGRALDEYILSPMGVKREQAWLCDLVPHSCVNEKQREALDRSYNPLVGTRSLPPASIPPVPKELADDARRQAILDELRASRAGVLVLLGDEPIQWFLRHFDPRWRRLSDFEPYGSLHDACLAGLDLRVLPLVHPRQAARLGRFSQRWFDAHQHWIKRGGTHLKKADANGRTG
jgi:uracil-DNA glycosylase